MRILVSGGGTAGHISPILATVDALRELDDSLEVLYVGQEGSMEERLASGAGIDFASIKSGKWRRNQASGKMRQVADLSTLLPNIRDAGRVALGLSQSLAILRRFRPDVVFTKGGFVGLPVGLAARLLRIPFVIHESDMAPGVANKILGRYAYKIAVSFPVKNYSRVWPKGKLVFTGNPIRREFVSHHRIEGVVHFGFDASMPVILVVGGSQGARRVNEFLLSALPSLTERYQILHLSGDGQYQAMQLAVSRLELRHAKRYVVRPSLDGNEMGLAYASGDLVIARAGAVTIAELAVLHKPTILIPNTTMAGHQVHNATALSRAGAVRVFREDRMTADQLVSEVDGVLSSAAEQERLGRAIGAFGVANAGLALATILLNVGTEPHKGGPRP